MNEAARMNGDMSRSYLKIGIIVLLVTAVIFIGKTLVGYERVTYYATMDNCTVTTKAKTVRMSRGNRTFYYVRVTHLKGAGDVSIDFDKLYDLDEDYDIYNDSIEDSEEELLFYCEVPYSYYKKFENYHNGTVTFYKDTDGIYYPVYSVDCTRAEAEHAYRQLAPPYGWYLLYALALMFGLLCFYLSIHAKRASDTYNELTTPYQHPFQQMQQGQPMQPTQMGQPMQINTPEDALSYMATERIRREKAQERASHYRRGRNRYRF